MNDLVRNGLIWLCGAALFLALRLVNAGEPIADGFQLVAILLFLVAIVQIVRGLLQDQR
jgi:hypothetical protein